MQMFSHWKKENKKSSPSKRRGEDLRYGEFIFSRYQGLGKQATAFAVLLGQAALAYCVAVGVAMGLLVNFILKLTGGEPVIDFSAIIMKYPLVTFIAIGVLFINLLYLSLLVGYGYVLGANHLKVAILGRSLLALSSLRDRLPDEPWKLGMWGTIYTVIAIGGCAIFPFAISWLIWSRFPEWIERLWLAAAVQPVPRSDTLQYLHSCLQWINALKWLHYALAAAILFALGHLAYYGYRFYFIDSRKP